MDELWERVTAFLALLASSGLVGWLLGGRRRGAAETRQIEITTDDAHDRAIAELRQMDAETHRVKVATLIGVIAASKQLALDYKTMAEGLELELKAERQSRAEERATWKAEREGFRQELSETQQQLAETTAQITRLTSQVEAQAVQTAAQTALITQQQIRIARQDTEIATLKHENAQLRVELDAEREKRRELEERFEDRDHKSGEGREAGES